MFVSDLETIGLPDDSAQSLDPVPTSQLAESKISDTKDQVKDVTDAQSSANHDESSGDSPDAKLISQLKRLSVGSEKNEKKNPVKAREPSHPDRYNFTFPSRGMAIVINQKDFDAKLEMTVRTGTDVDAMALVKKLVDLGFEVDKYDNLTRSQMLRVLRKAAKMDDVHERSDCFVCAILTHGEEGKVYGTDGTINIDDLVAPFKGDICRSLAGKPKLFFLQACRGQRLDHGSEVTDSADEVDANTLQRIPSEADFLMAYSVVPGYFSWRNSVRGSWFIQALCAVLEDYGTTLDILTLMTRVNRKVAYEFESNAAREYMNRKKQIPSIVSMLTKDLYFTPK